MAQTMVTRACDNCGQEFERTIGYINRRKKLGINKTFCTQKCYLSTQGTRTLLTCDNCGKAFERSSSNAARYESHFCSRDCYLRFKEPKMLIQQCQGCGKSFERLETQERTRQKEGLDKTFCTFECYKKHFSNRVVVKCHYCGKQYDVRASRTRGEKRIFCSQECWLSAHAAPPIIRRCEVCGDEIEEPAWFKGFAERRGLEVTHRRYCSRQCTGKAKLVPEARLEYSREFRSELRFLVRERDDHTCQECGAPETGRAHDVHHIDYNKRNNDMANLISLCRWCHTKTTGAGLKARQKWIDHYQQKMAEMIQ